MSSNLLEAFAETPAPGFRCCAAGDKSGKSFVARIQHILHPPASSATMAMLGERLGGHADRVAAFYGRHDGCVLYRDTLSDAAGIELLPVAQWEEATSDLRASLEHLVDDPDNDPDCILSGLAIATVPHSGNYFVMPIEGPSAGMIFYVDHDGWYESAFAVDFDDFLQRIVRDPVTLLAEDVGCYTRYSDGKTEEQWIPTEYFSDTSRLMS